MIRNQRGSSLVELIVASAILLVAFTATLSYVLHVKKSTQRLLTVRSRSVQLQKVAQLILADPKLFKVNFDSSEASACKALETDNLPLAWDDSKIAEIDDCIGCRGRLGYVIQPFPVKAIRGVYLVTIRVKHPTITQASSTVCDGQSIVGVEQLQMIVSLR